MKSGHLNTEKLSRYYLQVIITACNNNKITEGDVEKVLCYIGKQCDIVQSGKQSKREAALNIENYLKTNFKLSDADFIL